MRIFLYGTLRHAPLRTLVLGQEAPARAASLPGYETRWAKGESFPLLTGCAGGAADGLLCDVPAGALDRLDFYEAAFGYARRTVTVRTGAGPAEAQVYLCPGERWTPGAPWSLDDWIRDWAALSMRAAEEVMDRHGVDAPEDVGRTFTQTRVRANAWLRAQGDSTPNARRAGLTDADVEVLARRRPYRHFFMVEEQELRFRRFDGGQSEVVNRAAFVMGDAVTVLPYDPVRDRVLMVEQFRFGVHARGDRNPWSLEPVAGRIDPGETPETAARREAAEEAGVTLRGLELVGRYYPSPGGVTEYLYSYVGLTDLPDSAARIAGLDTEDEDIRGLILPFSELMAFLASGEAETAPLILSIQWLALNRDRLRSA